MKIGILTFHCAHNYGAVLQCYAMQEFLRRKGYDVEIINYRPKYLLDPYRLFDIRRIMSKNPMRILKGIMRESIIFPVRLKRYSGFEKFINNRLNLGKVVTKTLIPSDYDIYVVGSDQIWNSRITCGYDDVYFCNFPFEKGKKKYVSYAASMESKSLNIDAIPYFIYSLKKFDAISVREVELLNSLKSITNKTIVQVLDPTLMVHPQIWDEFPNKLSNEKYVLVYQVRENENTIRIAKNIAAQIGAKVKILVPWVYPVFKERDQDATPEEFVDYFRNASCVVTTSFHGTAFSIIHNRPFYTISLNDGANTRSASLLKSISLENRMINVNDMPIFSEIDYSQVNHKLHELRLKSQKFLLDSLNYE